MPTTDCNDQCECGCKRRRFLFRALICMAAVLLLGFVALVLVFWFLLLPSNPQFSLQDVSVHQFRVAPVQPGASLTSSMETTIFTHNPNRRVGIHYDGIRSFVTYKDQQVTGAENGLPMYQGHGVSMVWTPYFAGKGVFLESHLHDALSQDSTFGHVLLDVKLEAQIRWKIGPWKSGRRDLRVNCPAMFAYREPSQLHFQESLPACKVDVH